VLTADELRLRRFARGVLDLLDAVEAARTADDPKAKARARGLLLGAIHFAAYELKDTLHRLDAHEEDGAP
jgi:hypothetical protein